jgi:hypothetical protein
VGELEPFELCFYSFVFEPIVRFDFPRTIIPCFASDEIAQDDDEAYIIAWVEIVVDLYYYVDRFS